jgi:hypothetical protein
LEGTPKRVGKRKVGNRPPGGYAASESLSLADNWIANMHRQN